MRTNRSTFTRRAGLRATALAMALPICPGMAAAQTSSTGSQPAPPIRTGLVDPYSGAVPLTFPLAAGASILPLEDNWHAVRDGETYPWSHRAMQQRSHDGVDIHPLPGQPLPAVYAPMRATVASVCLRRENHTDAPLLSKVSGATPPPWDYSRAVDSVSSLPLYGNFVWLLSTDPASAGYWLFLCHLQNEPTIAALEPDQPVSPATPLGVLGDTGNAKGVPQLHVELHYPAEFGYRCRLCRPPTLLTGFNPFASLADAAPR